MSYLASLGNETGFSTPYGQLPAFPPNYGQQPAYPSPYGQPPVFPPTYRQQPAFPPIYGQQPTYPSPYGQSPVFPPTYGQQPVYPSPYGQPPVFPPTYGQQPAFPQTYGQQLPYGQQPGFPPAYGPQTFGQNYAATHGATYGQNQPQARNNTKRSIIPGVGPAVLYKIKGKINNKYRKMKHSGGPPPPLVRLPRITGNRRALVIGINYSNNQDLRLNGCINDAERQSEWLETMGFEDIYVLTDDTDTKPTVKNIKKAINWLVSDAEAGDSLFFHFSGHGLTNIIDASGDESDGFDEAILAIDGKAIVDDWFHNNLVEVVPEGAQLIAVFDCCHSGTSMDMPYMFDGTRFVRTELRGEHTGQVVCFSAAKDIQVAADTKRGGMLTDAFQRVMAQARRQPMPLGEFYKHLAHIVETEGPRLNNNQPQAVELAASHNIDLNSLILV